MTLSPGDRLGSYEILSALGAGGMGEVYRARDARLNRDVAIKVLPALFATDPERLARFTREAQVLASLNHPNIASIYGVVDVPPEGGNDKSVTAGVALVIELVEGEDLSVLIARGPLPLADALAIARQIADALEAAHELNIVHRDLKPANVKVRTDGRVKVLDFGLAKAMDPPDPSGVNAMNSPTLTVRGTQMGVIVGTAAYMAPEQARGKAVDRRADIWAFGVVLYEMLTGRQAFKGDDISEVLATVLKTEPDWQALPSGLPSSVSRLLRRCLEKDPRKRLSAIGDARLELDEQEPMAPPATAPASPPPRRRSNAVNIAVALLVLALVGIAEIVRLWRPDAGAVATAGTPHLSIPLPDGIEIGNSDRAPVAVSPDGRRVAYIGNDLGRLHLYVRALGDPESTLLAGTEGASSPFFSPDGEWIGFFAKGKLRKVTVDGTAMQAIADVVVDSRGGTWGPDGQIYFAPTNISSIWRVPASGGAATEVIRLDRAHGEISYRWPTALPDGQTILFSDWTGPGPDERQIVAYSLATGERRVLVKGGDRARYVADGHLIYARLDELFAIPWRPSDTQMSSAPPLVLPEHPRLENEGAAAYDLSASGTLVYVAGGAARYAQKLVWIDRAGNIEPLPVPERDYESVSLSPDGRQALVQIREGSMGLWRYDFARHTLTPLSVGASSSQAGVWTPDGTQVVYRGTRSGTRDLYRRAADGTGDEEHLTTSDGVQSPNSFSPDGKWLVFGEQSSRGHQLQALPLDNGHPGAVKSLVAGGENGQVSPDGKWLAYQIGGGDVYVQPFPGPGPRTQVSTDGGKDVLWSRSGKELFYVMLDSIMAVDVTTSPAFSAGTPHVVVQGRFRPTPNTRTAWDVSADGRRFLRIQQAQPERPLDRIDVALNWFAELKSK